MQHYYESQDWYNILAFNNHAEVVEPFEWSMMSKQTDIAEDKGGIIFVLYCILVINLYDLTG